MEHKIKFIFTNNLYLCKCNHTDGLHGVGKTKAEALESFWSTIDCVLENYNQKSELDNKSVDFIKVLCYIKNNKEKYQIEK